MMRLFVGLTLPESVRWQLTGLSSGLPGARWVPVENYHLTLRFIGEVDRHEAADIDAALAGISFRGFDLQLQGLGQFGDKRSTRAVWAGIASNPELTRLQAKIEQAIQRAGQAPESRKFKPHVTLARFKRPPGPKLMTYLTQHALFRSEPFPVNEFILFSSRLGGEGPVYQHEADYPLERTHQTAGLQAVPQL